LEIQQVTHLLDKNFKIKDLGKLKYFLGLEVAQTSAGIHVSQCKFAMDILELLAAKPNVSPIIKDNRQMFEEDILLEDINAYQCLISKSLYLNNTRPDISYAL